MHCIPLAVGADFLVSTVSQGVKLVSQGVKLVSQGVKLVSQGVKLVFFVVVILLV